MSDPTTPNIGLSKPVVNADADTWGTTLNSDLDIVDNIFPDDASGTAVGINTTGKTLGADNIKFPATQRSSNNANTLDDYEEGAWVVSIVTLNGGASQSVSNGYYTKIGRLVTVTGYALISSITSPSGTLKITGLPFPSANLPQGYSAATVAVDGLAGTTNYSTIARIAPNSSSIDLFKLVNNALADLGGDIAVNAEFYVSASYMAAT